MCQFVKQIRLELKHNTKKFKTKSFDVSKEKRKSEKCKK